MGVRQKMKIGLVVASISRNAGGLFESVRYLAFGLNDLMEQDVHIFSLNDKYTHDDRSAWKTLPVHLHDVKGSAVIGYSPELTDSLNAAKLDIIHSQGLWMYPSVASSEWAKRNSKPYLITPRGMLDPWALRNSYWKKRLAGFLFEDAHLRGAACLHALCESEAEAIRAYGLKNPICIIPNGIQAPSQAIAEIPVWRQALPNDAKVLLYLGRLHPKKGILLLLDAWANINAQRDLQDWHLVVAGWDQGGHEQVLKAKTESLKIQSHVHFIGAQFGEQKHACYSYSDAFILPSFSEGLPMTVLEAWSYGLPVVMTPQCNLPEGFQLNAAISVEPEVSSIENGLVKLFGMIDIDRVAIGANGKLLTTERFGWPHIADQMATVYRWVLGNGSKPDCVICD